MVHGGPWWSMVVHCGSRWYDNQPQDTRVLVCDDYDDDVDDNDLSKSTRTIAKKIISSICSHNQGKRTEKYKP